LRPPTRTSFHHQPEAQHPKSSAIHKLAGRLPHLSDAKRTSRDHRKSVARDPTATLAVHCGDGFDAGFSPYQPRLPNHL
jgi:hypothetical protein